MKVLQFPLVKITIFFVAGIVFAQFYKIDFIISIVALISSLFSLIISYVYSLKNSFKKSYFGILVLITSILLGNFTVISKDETRNPNHYLHKITDYEKPHISEITIIEKLRSSKSNDRYIATICTIDKDVSSGKIILNIKKSLNSPLFDIGNNLKINGKFYKNRVPNNPNQFDYGNYLEVKQIYGQFYCELDNVKIATKSDESLSYYASKIRNKIIRNLRKNKFNERELNVVAALILGQQQDISQDIMQDYQYAGAIHVLSVSGLHVGFILLFVSLLLKPLPNSKKGLFLKMALVIISIWLFGILAGLAPCVLRSVTMFTFVAVGMFLRRSINIYHTLLVSILLILLFEPSFLFDIGFQLSYVALFFIVWFQPVLSSIWSPKYKITSYFWDIVTVSIAAQIGTFPMCIYYFHQFAGLFLVTNLVILPFLTLILALGVLVLLLAAFNIVWLPMMKLLEWSIWLLNNIISWVASFDGFILKEIPLSKYMMISLYILLISFIVWLKKPSFKKLIFVLSAIVVVQFFFFQTLYSTHKKQELIVFNKAKNTLITARSGNQVAVISNDSILTQSNQDIVLKPYLIANFCKINSKKQISNLYYFKNKKILIIDSTAVYLSNKRPDILILSHSPKVSLERIFKSWKPEIVVVDASNFKSYIKIWKQTCAKEKIPFHATAEKGFYKLD